MSFLSKLFGGSAKPEPTAQNHNGFRIYLDPVKDGGQFRIGARIEKDIDGVLKTHMMIRADSFASAEAASEASLQKAKALIDQQGEQIF